MFQASHHAFDDPIKQSALRAQCPSGRLVAVSAAKLAVTLIGLDQVDDKLRSQWRVLSQVAAESNPYFSPWFLEPAMRHLDPAGDVQLCLLRRADDGLLVGLAPLVFQRGYSKLPLKHACIWTHRHCFNGAPLIREGHQESVFDALIDWIDTNPQGATFLRFAQLPFGYDTEKALKTVCQRQGRRFFVQERHERAVLLSDNEYTHVISAAMSSKKRKELRRQARRFAEMGTAAFVDLPIEDGSAIDDFIAMENAGWKGLAEHGFPIAQSAAESAFFREAMIAGAQEGAVSCRALTLDGVPKAMLFTLDTGVILSLFKTAYDETLGAYSPGIRVLMDATEQMLGDAVSAAMMDSCAKPDHPVVNGLWSERMAIAQVNIPAKRGADKRLLATAAALEGVKKKALKRLKISSRG